MSQLALGERQGNAHPGDSQSQFCHIDPTLTSPTGSAELAEVMCKQS